jgi:LysM repeat protein
LNPNLNCQNLPIGQQICVPTIDASNQPINPNPVQPNTCTNFYTLFPGDTCDSIASAFKTTLQSLLSININLNCQSLPIGQQICVPNIDTVNPINPSTCANYYSLFAGDTCESIAVAYRITVQALLTLNPNLNCQSLPAGSLICVPSIDGNNQPSNPIQGCSFYYVLFSGDTCDS